MRDELIKNLVGTLTKEEDIDNFIDICNEYGVKILSSLSGPEIRGFDSAQGIDGEVTVQLKDGQIIELDIRVIRDGLHSRIAKTTLGDIFDTFNKIPKHFKENFKNATAEAYGNSCAYTGDGHINLSGDFYKYSDKHDLNFRGAIIHEIFHSFDLGTGTINGLDDVKKLCNQGLSNGKGFREILKHEESSFYSQTYNPKSNTYGEDQKSQSVKYGTESFAEAMKITGKYKLFGDKYAYINVPVYNSNGTIVASRTVTYNEWTKISPNMAKLSEQVWNANSRSEARNIMENYKYDSNLKADVLTTENYRERSIVVED